MSLHSSGYVRLWHQNLKIEVLKRNYMALCRFRFLFYFSHKLHVWNFTCYIFEKVPKSLSFFRLSIWKSILAIYCEAREWKKKLKHKKKLCKHAIRSNNYLNVKWVFHQNNQFGMMCFYFLCAFITRIHALNIEY